LEIKEFISSGILEAYVLGNATPDEIKLVREMELLYPEVKEEIDSIEATLMSYSEDLTQPPSRNSENKFREAIFNTKSNQIEKVVNVNENSRKQIVFLRYAVAACIAALIISGTFNFYLNSKINRTETEIAGIRNENNELSEQLDDLQTTIFEKNNELAMIMKPGSKMISLKGMQSSPSSHAMIVWNQEEKMVLLNSVSLPAPPEGMQYQLWAIMDGKTVNAGVFDIREGESIMLKMQDMPPAQAFAVTLEKMGGSETPNMNAMYLKGDV
jgi:hypothetical protein